MARKQLWLLAGGNGAGKSTFFRLFLQPRGMQFVNADLIAGNLDSDDSEGAAYQAAVLARHFCQELLEQGVSFCFETVFSHPSKIDLIASAKGLGYEVVLVYLHLVSTDLNQARVAQRVSEGGHKVPADKIVSRLPRTMAHVRTVIPLADQARLLDNSSLDEPFQPVATVRHGEPTLHIRPLPRWAGEILADYPEAGASPTDR